MIWGDKMALLVEASLAGDPHVALQVVRNKNNEIRTMSNGNKNRIRGHT